MTWRLALSAVVVGTLAALAGRAATPASATPAAGPSAPTGPVAVADESWVSGARGWVVTVDPACSRACRSVVWATGDGGASWVRRSTLPTCRPCGGTAPVTAVTFANGRDGYAFGPELFATTDGGRSWHRQRGPFVADLTVAGTTAVRMAYTTSGCPGPCAPRLEAAPVGTGAWRPLVTGALSADAVQLVASGADDLYAALFAHPDGGAPDQQTTLLTSLDGGATWTTRADPCGWAGPVENDTVAIAAGPGQALAALCVPRGEQIPDFVELSENAGTTFTTTAPLPGPSVFGLIAIASPTTILVGTPSGGVVGTTSGGGAGVLEASTDGGRDWTEVASTASGEPGVVTSEARGDLSFTSAEVGHWVGGGSSVWTTSDGGATWTPTTVRAARR